MSIGEYERTQPDHEEIQSFFIDVGKKYDCTLLLCKPELRLIRQFNIIRKTASEEPTTCSDELCHVESRLYVRLTANGASVHEKM